MADPDPLLAASSAPLSPSVAPLLSGPPDVLMQLRDALQGEAEAVRRRERGSIERLLASHDAARERLPEHTLVATTDFTRFTDDAPEGEVVKMGQEFTVSEFDLPRYLGKGLPRANEVTPSGVTISQA